MYSANWKENAKNLWNTTPCGSVGEITGDLNYFLEVETNRYEEYAPWMKSFFEFGSYSGKKVLEIGFGQGTDLIQFSLAGAQCFGIDISERHLTLAKKNFELRGLEASLILQDASHIHFESNMFDLVYSFGVLHHTPDIQKCFLEAYRVLKPGGKFIITVYHKYSAFHLFSVLLANGFARRRYFTLGYDGLLSTIEKGADGITIKPFVRLYSPKKLKAMLVNFGDVSVHIKHLKASHFWKLEPVLPSFLLDFLEAYLGWYVVAKATK